MASDSQRPARHAVAADKSAHRMAHPIFRRSEANPIIMAQHLPFRASAVMNPGAAEHAGETVLLLRVEDMRGYSNLYVARSADGIVGWRIAGEPLLGYGDPTCPHEAWGCEDARITYVPEEQCWYITYVAYSELGPAVALARTTDFVEVERLGVAGATNDKDGALLPCKFDKRWCMLHRPEAAGTEHIWAAYSTDLVRWGEPHCVMFEGVGPAWDGLRIGIGPPPIETKHGWLLIYHGVKEYGNRMIYRAGLALLDRAQPDRLIARTPGWVFEAEEPYEVSGLVPNVVFPTGALLRDNEVWLYYGAADTCICLATAKLEHLLALLKHAP